VKIGFKFQSPGKIPNILTADRPALLGQFQHWLYVYIWIYIGKINHCVSVCL